MNSYPSPIMTLTYSYAPSFYHDHTGFNTRETQINCRRLYNYKLYTKPEEILLQVLLVLDGTDLPIRRRKALRSVRDHLRQDHLPLQLVEAH